MKLLIALVCSGLLHLVWLFIWPLHLNDHPNKNALSNHEKPLELNIKLLQSNRIKPSKIAAKKNVSKKFVNQTQPHLHTLAQNKISQVALTEPQKDIREVYLATKEVDIQALPINNIDASMLPDAIQNYQVKLRLFIDEFGKVVRIEPIQSQIYQDEALEAALSDRLTSITFTPAKRDGVNVKSYQDVAFGFNPDIHLSQANSAN